MNKVFESYMRAFAEYTATRYCEQVRKENLFNSQGNQRVFGRAAEVAACCIQQMNSDEFDGGSMLIVDLILAQSRAYRAAQSSYSAFIAFAEDESEATGRAKEAAEVELTESLAAVANAQEALFDFEVTADQIAATGFLKFLKVVKTEFLLGKIREAKEIYGSDFGMGDEDEASAAYESAAVEFCAAFAGSA